MPSVPPESSVQPTRPPAERADADGFDPGFFAPLHAVEDRHFWFRGRNRAISALAARAASRFAPGYRVLEVGCGTGNVLRVLEESCEQGSIVGMDLFAEGLSYARRRTSCPLVQGDMHSPPFGKPFDLIGLFDVLEHLSDDLQVLRTLHTMLAQNGLLLLTVPAHQSLWSYFDEASHHVRRYDLVELEAKLASTGYRTEYMTEYMVSTLPMVWLRRLLERASRRSTDRPLHAKELAARELQIIPGVNGLLTRLLSLEARAIACGRKLPAGSSLIVAARKNGASAQ